ncbi:MAG: FtsX-like permease family protein [Proteobacteria bacterium]|nr:FtsX-like permease family protein [Pseudomonadota bacterium]
MSTLPLSLRLALREMRGGLRGFRIFLAALALGVGAITAVGTLSEALVRGLEEDARGLLGGDIEIRQTALNFRPAETAYLRANSEAAALAREIRATAHLTKTSARTLVELKSVEEAYPLYGAVVLDPPLALADALGRRGDLWGAVVERALLTRLGGAVGDVIELGGVSFQIRAVIDEEPDLVANTFSLGPRVMVGSEGFAETGLGILGSLVRNKYRVRLAEGTDYGAWITDLREAFPDALWRVRDAARAQPSVERFIDRLAVFLTLAGVTALLVGGIGVGQAVQAYLAGKTETIATLKCLGARSGTIFRIYLTQIGIMALVGTALGLALGVATAFAAVAVFADSLPVPTRLGFHAVPLFRAAAFGALTAFVFSVWPLALAREVPAAGLFRAIVAPIRRWPRAPYVAATLLALAGLVTLTVLGSGEARIARGFVVGAAAMLILYRGIAALIILGARRLGRTGNTTVRLALANLTRPGAPTAGVVVSLGVGLTVLVATALVQGNIARQVSDRIPKIAPAFFFLDIQPGQAAEFDELLRTREGFVSLERTPNLQGRLTGVNGVPVGEVKMSAEIDWVRDHDFGFSYAAEKPPRADLSDGDWWPAEIASRPIISLDEGMAHGLGIGIGDTLAFIIAGREVVAEIANLRRIDWTDFGIQYHVVFAPGALETFPQTHLATATVEPDGEDAFYRDVTDRFNNISVIRVKEALETASRILTRIGAAVTGIAALTILSGVLVLAGAVAAGHRRRIYDAVILKVLGATRRDILKAYLLEFAFLGLAAAGVAAVAGTLAAWVLIARVMDAGWVFLPLQVFGTVAMGVGITVTLGFVGTWLALGHSTAAVLRAE